MADALPRDVRRIAVVVIIGAVMSILDTTIVNVALETLRIELGASLSTIQWVSTGYLLALATAIPLTGWAAERFGPKRVWMSAVAAFVVTSGLCGLAWSVESLIGFRVLQGFAGGMIMPIGMITLAQAAGPGRMGRVMSVVGVPMLLAPVLGPVIGGAIVESLSWRWIFFVNLPVGIAGLLLARRLLPSGRAVGRASADGHEHPVLDWRGLALLSPGVARDRVRHLRVRSTSHVVRAERLAAPRPRAAGRRSRSSSTACARVTRSSTSACSGRAASPPPRRRCS